MGIATPSSLPSILSHHNSNSMSQDYHHHQQQGIFNFPNGFDRSATVTQDHHNPPQQAQHVAQHQIRRDKVRVHQGFDPPQQPSLVPHPIEEDQSGGGGLNPVYETAGMLSEMFNFAPNAAELLEQQQQQQQSMTTTFRPSTRAVSSGGSNWYGNRQGMLTALGPLGDSNKNHHHHNRDSSSSSSTMVHHHHHNNHHHHHHQMPNINADSAAAMHLFLMNPQPTRSPSPPQPPPSSTLHMFPPPPGGSFGNFTWTQEGGTTTNTVVEGQGLSLSLSSSLEAAKAEELRMGDSAFLYYNNQASGGGGASSSAQFPYNKSLSGQPVHIQGGIGIAQNHAGFGASASTSASLGVVNVLRNSKYVKPAQELLEEFCSVGRGQFKKNKFGRQLSNPSSNPAGGNGGSSSSSKDVPPLSAADRIEHQRRKVKLLTMLDEVDRRYKHYCEQMHMVVSSFDLVMGFGGAVPYTALAQKAMSRHFRCLKDAIMTQLKHSCELLGEKDGAGNSGLTKGETPRLKLLEQSLRQQRAFHQMGMMEQEAWRPQRGLPERSVNILRAWLFEHFLHPYPSDADKHLLARQTGLSRNQVSNWFINARVRLWKPMVEDMYQQELKEADQGGAEERERNQSSSNSGHQQATAQTPTPSTTATSSTPPPPTTTMPTPKRSDFNASESDPSIPPTNNNNNNNNSTTATTTASASEVAPPSELPRSLVTDDTCRHGSLVTTTDYGTASSDIGSSTLIRFGTTAGDVSLTLGLRHAGNMPDKTPFSLRDFGAI